MKICKKFKKGKNYVTANALEMEEEEGTQGRNLENRGKEN
jgi:hypothetical protein